MTKCLCEEQERNTSQVRTFSRDHEKHRGRTGLCTGQKKGSRKPEKSLTIRYRNLPEEIQRVSRQDQEDLDTNRGAAGQKTWRGGPPTQERGQMECSRHA